MSAERNDRLPVRSRRRSIASNRWLRSALLLPVLLLVASGSASASSAAPTSTVYRFGDVGSQSKVAALELDTPTAVSGISGAVVQVATSNSDGYALTSSGAVYAWGVASDGELGNGTTSPYDASAVKVTFPAGVRIATLANPMPFDGALAIDSSGHVWGWGLDADGDLCLSSSTNTFNSVLTPSRLPLSGVTLATGALTHSLFDSHGRVYACGSGQNGVLGDGSTTSQPTPTAVVDLPTTSAVTALTSSWGGAGALLGNGSYYDWGYNAAGQLGDGTTGGYSDVPVHVRLPSAVRLVSQGGSSSTNGQTIAILANGSVQTWGNNQDGQLGNGTRVNSDLPEEVSVPTGVTFSQVNSGGSASYAIDSSGRLWSWGSNDNGQLGTGSSIKFVTHPVDVGIDLTQVSSTAYNVAGFGPASG
jgi:alpha-tubulin suppressor-like RCC1 family protein